MSQTPAARPTGASAPAGARPRDSTALVHGLSTACDALMRAEVARDWAQVRAVEGKLRRLLIRAEREAVDAA